MWLWLPTICQSAVGPLKLPPAGRKDQVEVGSIAATGFRQNLLQRVAFPFGVSVSVFTRRLKAYAGRPVFECRPAFLCQRGPRELPGQGAVRAVGVLEDNRGLETGDNSVHLNAPFPPLTM